MALFESDDDSIFLPQDGTNKQAPSSQKDLFEDDSDSNSEIGEQYNKQTTLSNKLHFLPAVAVPEKIVFCVDTTLNITDGYLLEDSQQPPTTQSVRNEAIRVFVTNKLSIAKDTEFGLVSLAPGKAELISPLNSNIKVFMKRLAGLKITSTSNVSEYDISPMFNIVCEHCDIPEESKSTAIPPSYILRIVLIYGNSFLEPNINITSDYYKNIISSPFCMFDVLYLHDTPSDSNNVEQIFKCLVKMAPEQSYVLENARNVTTMFSKMSKLLAHPYQRVPQDKWIY